MEILDTQIVSYAIKGKSDIPIVGKSIASITANEFLLVQNSSQLQANYYVPILSNRHYFDSGLGSMDHPFSKKLTDQVILEFGNDYPTIIEFGNLAISLVINNQVPSIFDGAVKFIDKEQRKIVRKRFRFLLENNVQCIALNRSTVALCVTLLHEFTAKYTLKGNFRNTLNDLLVLATAIRSSGRLVTEDKLLMRFAADQYSKTHKRKGNILTIDFDKDQTELKRKTQESKGYVNRQWAIRFKNYSTAIRPA
jgi:hypothetical protein